MNNSKRPKVLIVNYVLHRVVTASQQCVAQCRWLLRCARYRTRSWPSSTYSISTRTILITTLHTTRSLLWDLWEQAPITPGNMINKVSYLYNSYTFKNKYFIDIIKFMLKITFISLAEFCKYCYQNLC